MPYNGAGVFTSLGVPKFPAVSGEFILASYFNANLTDIFTGLSLVLTRDGQSAPTTNLPMANFTFTALGAATLAGNPLVYGQSNASLTSLTLTGILTLPTPASNISTTQAVNAEWVSTYYATKNDAVLTGVPTAPTAALGTNTAQLATMAALKTQADLLALANDTVLTGVPTAPTAAPGTNTTQLATTAFVAAQAFSASLPNQAGNAGKFVTTNGTVASWVSATAGDHEVYVNSGNGLGSVNTYVRRFTTTVRNVGTAITYADSATLGASFTINETGFYSVYYADAMSGGSNRCCIGINTSPTASAPTVFATPSSLAGDFIYTNVGVTTFSSRVVRLTAGDVLRPYNSFTTNGFGDAAVIIRKVGV